MYLLSDNCVEQDFSDEVEFTSLPKIYFRI